MRSIGIFMILCLSVMMSCVNKKTIPELSITKSTYLKKVFKSDNGNELLYRVYYPRSFDPSKKYPLLLFMHGSGERGSDNELQLTHGADLIAKKMDDLGGIAIFPQCPKESYWVNINRVQNTDDVPIDFVVDTHSPVPIALQSVMQLVADFRANDYIDNKRFYVSGLSMGGMATFDLLWRMNNDIAAAAPICGAGAPEKAFDMVNIPIRIYHGKQDPIVPIKESMVMEKAIKRLRGNVEAFYYDGVGHESWTNAFAEDDFIEWLFQHSNENK